MPFPNQVPKPFTRENVLNLRPGQMGCYGLFRQGEWVYVGKGDIRQRLLDHLNGDNPCITLKGPTHWMDVVTAYYDDLERQLIAELQPTCNRRVG